MPNLPTAEDAAKYILKIYVEDNNLRPRDVLRLNNFFAVLACAAERNRPWYGSYAIPMVSFRADS